ncbi:MAG: hypothetical protein ACO3EE_05920 [Flavobacteriales bacterium]
MPATDSFESEANLPPMARFSAQVLPKPTSYDERGVLMPFPAPIKTLPFIKVSPLLLLILLSFIFKYSNPVALLNSVPIKNCLLFVFKCIPGKNTL